MAYSTTPTHGKTARVEKNDVAIDHIMSWDLNINPDMADISRQGQSAKENLPGQYGWGSNIQGHCVMGNTEQKALHDACLAGTELTDMKWLINGSTEGWNGAGAFVSSMTINASNGDKVGISFGLTGNGAITLSDAQ